ncbi:MAG TPA: nuclease-related domain-containing protein [Candidatus Limnocylindrales bacterium]
MHVTRPVGRRSPGARVAVAGAAAAGIGWLAIAGSLGLLAVSTPIVDRLMLGGRVGPSQAALGALAWALALTAPAAFAILGLSRIVLAVEAAVGRRPRPGPVASVAASLGPDVLVAGPVVLPDGRRIPELVVGPHGVVLFETLPPPAASRHEAGRWEVRVEGGRWVPMENPLDRAVRDAERVRRWLAADDRDFVVKVHAVVIAQNGSDVPRTPACAVITRDQIPGLLASLPPQRSLSPSRRRYIEERVRSLG